MPCNYTAEYEYRTICPGSQVFTEDATAIIQNISEDLGAQLTLSLDFDCKRAVDWCEAHPETQGRYIDPDESQFTYKEFKMCADFFLEWVVYLGPWHVTGDSCSSDQFCTEYGVCALSNFLTETVENGNYTCCDSQEALADDVTGFSVCTNQAVGM